MTFDILAAQVLLAPACFAACLLAVPRASHARLRALRQRRPAATRTRVQTIRQAAAQRWARRQGPSGARRRKGAIDLCQVIAAEVRAGRTPSEALRTAVSELDRVSAAELEDVLSAATIGADPVPALRAASEPPGASGLRYLAAAWQVAASTGGGLAEVAERLAGSLAHAQGQRLELAAQLAGPRTTAILLSVLPLLGLAMAGGMGNRPVMFLLSTPLGLGCLALGGALDALGLWWTRRITGKIFDALEPS